MIETISVAGRIPKSMWLKCNPLWWFANDDDPEPPDWYLPAGRLRKLRWYLRNPLHNFGLYVVGVADRNYTVTGPVPVMATTWDDAPALSRSGFKWSVIRLGMLRLPLVSYASPRLRAYLGWQANGKFGAKFNIKQSPVQVA